MSEWSMHPADARIIGIERVKSIMGMTGFVFYISIYNAKNSPEFCVQTLTLMVAMVAVASG